jgi:hypothetical protein
MTRTKKKKTPRRVWDLYSHDVFEIAQECRAGDKIQGKYTEEEPRYRKIIELLAPRRLVLVICGWEVFILPHHEHLGLIGGLAHGEADAYIHAAAKGLDGSLRGLLRVIFGGPFPPTLPDVLTRACRVYDAEPLSDEKANSSRRQRIENAEKRCSKLSKLQHDLLDWASAFHGGYADVCLLPQGIRSTPPALSRAWRRLKERGPYQPPAEKPPTKKRSKR